MLVSKIAHLDKHVVYIAASSKAACKINFDSQHFG
jgi:hypothetical protein